MIPQKPSYGPSGSRWAGHTSSALPNSGTAGLLRRSPSSIERCIFTPSVESTLTEIVAFDQAFRCAWRTRLPSSITAGNSMDGRRVRRLCLHVRFGEQRTATRIIGRARNGLPNRHQARHCRRYTSHSRMRREDAPSIETKDSIHHLVTTQHRCCRQPDQRDDRDRGPYWQPGRQCDQTCGGHDEGQFARSANQTVRDPSAGLHRSVRQCHSQRGGRVADRRVTSYRCRITPICRAQQLEKLSDHVIGGQPDRFGVLAHERAAINPGRPSREIISLEVVEQRPTDLDRLG